MIWCGNYMDTGAVPRIKTRLLDVGGACDCEPTAEGITSHKAIAAAEAPPLHLMHCKRRKPQLIANALHLSRCVCTLDRSVA